MSPSNLLIDEFIYRIGWGQLSTESNFFSRKIGERMMKFALVLTVSLVVILATEASLSGGLQLLARTARGWRRAFVCVSPVMLTPFRRL